MHDEENDKDVVKIKYIFSPLSNKKEELYDELWKKKNF